jgi:hypothetical protein
MMAMLRKFMNLGLFSSKDTPSSGWYRQNCFEKISEEHIPETGEA